MKIQQLRFVTQVVASGFNVTSAAEALHTSQSGVSHQIRLLEDELSAVIFLRQGKRLLGLTEVGKELVQAAQDVLVRTNQLKTIAADFDEARPAELVLATTHLHARYTLLPVISAFAAAHRSTKLRLIQTFPEEIFQLLEEDRADFGLTTESLPRIDRFDTLPAYPVGRCLITPIGHPLLKVARPSLADIAAHALITYDSRLTSGRTVAEAFAKNGIVPNVVLSAVDVDVIKTYVGAGLGVAVVPRLAYEAKADTCLGAVGLSHIFADTMTHIVTRRGKYMRRQARAFMDLLAVATKQVGQARVLGRREAGSRRSARMRR